MFKYRMLEMAIGEIDGLDFRQQLRDHDKWLESIYVWKAGLEGIPSVTQVI